MVFVHGFACSHTDWSQQVAHFSPRHVTVAVDLPGHGATPAPSGTASIEACGAAVAELLGVLALPPALLVGHSMGCRVVLDAAQRVSECVAGIALVDGSRFAPGMAEVFEERFAAGDYLVLARDMFEQMFTARTDKRVAGAVIQRALALPEPIGQALLLSLVRYDTERLEPVLAGLKKPLMALQTTFTNDRRERVSLQAGQTTPYLDFLRDTVPGARVMIIPDVGHFPQLDAPAETNRALADFVAGLA